MGGIDFSFRFSSVFEKSRDLIRNEFSSVQFEKRGSVCIFTSYVIIE